MSPKTDSRRRLPAVDGVLRDPALLPSLELYGRELTTVQVRRELDRLRGVLAKTGTTENSIEQNISQVVDRVVESLERTFGTPLRRIINATGIFLHTNLGRAPLPRSVVARLIGLLDAYCDLEYRLDSGQRGERNARVDPLLAAITGAEAGILVNNNAAALVLILQSLASGRQAIVSRGELVEIGGSFRIPDILRTAGVELVEVGTTNRTRASDYTSAISEVTGMLLKVYPSNYRQSGFTAAVEPAELVEIGREHGVLVVVDEGSGLLRPHHSDQLRDHPSISELIAAGCDLVCGSGDKLLGGPQAGVIVGRRDLVDRCRRDPLYRALRPDRFTFAGVEEVLRMHAANRSLPVDRLWPDREEHARRLELVAEEIGATIVPADAFLGGGSAPERPIPGRAVALPGRTRWLEALRSGTPPVIAYLREGRLVLDLRTVDPADDATLIEAVRNACGRRAG